MQTFILILWNLYGLEAFPEGRDSQQISQKISQNLSFGTEKIVTPEIIVTNVTNESLSNQSMTSSVTSSVTIITEEREVIEEVTEISGDNIIRTTIIEEEEDTDRPKLVLMAIASSCILVAISIIGAGICFYKKYGYSHYGSGHIRILSEDGSIEEEVLFTMYRNGDIQPRHPNCEKFEKRRGRNMGYVYADRSGNIIKNGIVNPLKSASLPLTSSSSQPHHKMTNDSSRPVSIATPGGCDNRIMVEVERDITTELPSTQSSVIPTDDVISDDVIISDESSSSSLPPSPTLSEKSNSTSTKNRAVDSKSDLLAIDE